MAVKYVDNKKSKMKKKIFFFFGHVVCELQVCSQTGTLGTWCTKTSQNYSKYNDY